MTYIYIYIYIQSTLGLLLKPGSGPWMLKNLDPEKHGINMGLKNLSAFKRFNKENAQCNLQFKRSCTNFDI